MADNWHMPRKSGWHWLRSRATGNAVVGRFHHDAPVWTILTPGGDAMPLDPELAARHFDYIGKIEEPRP